MVSTSTSEDVSHFVQYIEQMAGQDKKRKLETVHQVSERQTVAKLHKTSQSRVYSDDMSDCCKHSCKICDKLVSLTGMRSHTKLSHRMSIGDYIKTFGNYRTALATIVYHKCRLCEDEILLDGDEIHKHSRVHKITMKDYTTQFIKEKMRDSRSKVTEYHGANIIGLPTPEIKKIQTKLKRDESVTKARGVWSTLQAIENILDSLSRNRG